MDLSQRLKAARKAKGLSQAELARAVGLKQAAVGHIESGRSSNSKYLPQIAQFLSVNYDWLLTGQGDMHLGSRSSVDSGIRMVPLRSLSDLTSETRMRQATQYLPAPADCSKGTYAITVDSDSMVGPVRSYPLGTIVYVDPALITPRSGQRVIALVDGHPMFREFRIEGPASYLIALNPSYPTMTTNNAQILGTVIGSFLPE